MQRCLFFVILSIILCYTQSEAELEMDTEHIIKAVEDLVLQRKYLQAEEIFNSIDNLYEFSQIYEHLKPHLKAYAKEWFELAFSHHFTRLKAEGDLHTLVDLHGLVDDTAEQTLKGPVRSALILKAAGDIVKIASAPKHLPRKSMRLFLMLRTLPADVLWQIADCTVKQLPQISTKHFVTFLRLPKISVLKVNLLHMFYWKYRPDFSRDELITLARHLRQISGHPTYDNLPLAHRLQLQNIQRSMPPRLRVIFFSSKVCVQNENFRQIAWSSKLQASYGLHERSLWAIDTITENFVILKNVVEAKAAKLYLDLNALAAGERRRSPEVAESGLLLVAHTIDAFHLQSSDSDSYICADWGKNSDTGIILSQTVQRGCIWHILDCSGVKI